MNKINMLDCTLRDGGYCNQWEFGYENIKKIIQGLIEAEIDIIECGYLTDREGTNVNKSKYLKLEELSLFLPSKCEGKMFVVMMNWDEYDIQQLPHCNETFIDGIRVAFHKDNMQKGLDICTAVKEKGYKVFVQAMASLNYNDREFLDLLEKINKLNPYAFYIVDSFGIMKKKRLMHMLYMVEKNLSENVWIGFHSHNNLQLAYANAQCLVDMPMNRNLIIDSSVYGMGRGAGNLNTELFVDYLNENYSKGYKNKPLLGIIDEILSSFYDKNPWGYTLPNYLSAIHNIHPNYASFLDAKKTLTVKEIDSIFSMFKEEKKDIFDRDYIEEKYIEFLDQKIDLVGMEKLKRVLRNKIVLLIAPGNSAVKEKDKIKECVKDEKIVTICVNFNYTEIETDFIFLSNLRRYRELEINLLNKCIVTSNIPANDIYAKIRYKDLLNEKEYVQDNAGLMLINLLIKLNIKKVLLAGFDGYSYDENENYLSQEMVVYRKKDILGAMNYGIQMVLQEYRKKLEIEFLTKQKHICFNDNKVSQEGGIT